MTLPRYAECRESGVEWLGELPSHWCVRKFRHSFQESSEKIDGRVFGPMLSVSGYRGIEIKEYDDDNRRRSDEDLEGYRIVRPGQLVVNTMWLNYAGLGVSAHEGHVSPAYRAYRIASDLEPRFVHHMMRSGEFVKGYTKFLTGIRPNSLQMSRDDLMEFRLAEPPRREQVAIAEFLDRETAKIDALIAEQEKLLSLLAEKRQATISHAVTRGLDPNAPMKDSGIPWLGEIPAHWRVDRFKASIVAAKNGIWGTDAAGDSSDIPCVRVADFDRRKLVVGAVVPTLRSIRESERQGRVLQRGDLLLEKSGGGETQPVGQVVLYDCDESAVCSNFVARVELKPGMDSRYWRFTHAAAYSVRLNVRSIKQTSGIQNLDQGQYFEERAPFPPADEQRLIADFLDQKTQMLDALEDEGREAIRLLMERRSALISAAVTGKIDVRRAEGDLAA